MSLPVPRLLLPLLLAIRLHADPSAAPGATSAASDAPAAPSVGTSAADSAAPFPGKLPSREPWERWVNLPGTVLWFLPDLALRGAGAAIGYADEAKLIPRIHRVLVSEDGTRAVLPAYSVQTGAGVTLRKKNLLTEGSRLSLLATAGEDWRHEAAFAFRRLRLPGGFETDLSLDYRFLTEEVFFGIGPRTRESEASDYSLLQLEGEWTLAARQVRHLRIEAKGGLLRGEVIEGRDDDFRSLHSAFDESTAPGMSEPATFAKARLDLRLDNYDGPDPRRGGELLLTSAFYNEVGDLPYAFARFGAHAEHLVPVAYGRVLAFRLSAEQAVPLPDRGIPFYALPEIGRDGTVRGYTRGRLRDRGALYGAAEYRWPVWTPHFHRALEFLLFADAGHVARSLPDGLDADLLKAGYGGGVRYYGKEGLITRLEMGVSGERLRFYFSLN